MAILNLGSINIDHVYSLPHLPKPGETLAAAGYTMGLGGKGANHSIAIARAGGDVRHLGAVGPEGAWCLDDMAQAGVDVSAIARLTEVATGHAIINVDAAGENAIVIHAGANRRITEAAIQAALETGTPGDWLLVQNETNLTRFAVREARVRGWKTACAAAPFDARMVAGILPDLDLLAVNAVEAEQLAAALGTTIDVPQLLITQGGDGAVYRARGRDLHVPARRVAPVDTTGAGDCFLGYFLAGLDTGLDAQSALDRAATAAAIQVTRPGAATAIPTLTEVTAFRT